MKQANIVISFFMICVIALVLPSVQRKKKIQAPPIIVALADTDYDSFIFGLPSQQDDTTHILLEYQKICIMYNTETRNPDWVLEYITKSDVDSELIDRKIFDPTNDPNTEAEADEDDYKYSGYDLGHMAPAENFESSKQAMTECFYMTNFCPQKHGLNGGRWSSMEDHARRIAQKFTEAYIISGPVYFESDNPKICHGKLKDRVEIPQAFFKIIVYKDKDQVKRISFFIPHLIGAAATYKNYMQYQASIDSIENWTGFDFFADMEDKKEAAFESAP